MTNARLVPLFLNDSRLDLHRFVCLIAHFISNGLFIRYNRKPLGFILATVDKSSECLPNEHLEVSLVVNLIFIANALEFQQFSATLPVT